MEKSTIYSNVSLLNEPRAIGLKWGLYKNEKKIIVISETGFLLKKLLRIPCPLESTVEYLQNTFHLLKVCQSFYCIVNLFWLTAESDDNSFDKSRLSKILSNLLSRLQSTNSCLYSAPFCFVLISLDFLERVEAKPLLSCVPLSNILCICRCVHNETHLDIRKKKKL